MALAKAVAASYPEKVLLEVAPVQSHQSMGHVERAHRLLQEQLRVNRFELEEHLKEKLELTIPLGSWLVRHASWQLFRFLGTQNDITQDSNEFTDEHIQEPLYDLVKRYLHEFTTIRHLVFIAIRRGWPMAIRHMGWKIGDDGRTPCC